MPGLDELESPQQPAGQRRHAISDDHRSLDERRLERRGAGGDEHGVAGGERLLGAAVDEVHRHTAPHAARARRSKRLARPRRSPSARRTDSSGRACAARRRSPQMAGPDLLTSPPRLPGSTAITVPAAGRPSARARRRRIRLERNPVGERMPDEHGASRSARRRTRLSNGSRHSTRSTALADRAHAPLPPGPDLRAHVLHGRRCPSRLSAAATPQVELRRVDADEASGPRRQHARDEFAPQHEQTRQVPDDLGQAHDRERRPTIATPYSPRPACAGRRCRRTRASASRSASARISAAPRLSPDASPATRPNVAPR